MTLYRFKDDFDPSLLEGASCAFGVFDGVHLGHRFLIDQAIASAEQGPSMVITFDIDPDEVFAPKPLRKLMTNDERLATLEASGVDAVVVFPFTKDLYGLEPEDFLATAFGAGAPAHLHVGEDFRFGNRAEGTVEDLRLWAQGSDTEIHSHELLVADGAPITSSRIRDLLGQGEVRLAAALLGHPYHVCGIVRPGRGDGTGFGFATANLELTGGDRAVANGVYGGYAWVEGPGSDDHRRYRAAISVGVTPTFEEISTADLEVHLLDFEGDLVDKTVCVEFIEWLRSMRRFDSTEELIATVNRDIDWVRENL